MIGIILLATIHCGRLPIKKSRFTTHVPQVGVFPMEEVMVFGRRPVLMILLTTAQTKVYRSISALRQLPGIQLRVLATTTMDVCTMSVRKANIGLPLLAASARTSCSSATVAASVCGTSTVARTVSQSVASKNKSYQRGREAGAFTPFRMTGSASQTMRFKV